MLNPFVACHPFILLNDGIPPRRFATVESAAMAVMNGACKASGFRDERTGHLYDRRDCEMIAREWRPRKEDLKQDLISGTRPL